MTKTKNLMAIGAVAAVLAGFCNIFAQDDLDALLQDLEGELPAEKKQHPADAADAAVAQDDDAVQTPGVAPAVAEAAPAVDEIAPAAEKTPEQPAVAAAPEIAAEPEPAVAEAAPAADEVAPAAEKKPEQPAVAAAPEIVAEPEPVVAEAAPAADEVAPAAEKTPEQPAVAAAPEIAAEPEPVAEPEPAAEPEIAASPAPAANPEMAGKPVNADNAAPDAADGENISIINKLAQEIATAADDDGADDAAVIPDGKAVKAASQDAAVAEKAPGGLKPAEAPLKEVVAANPAGADAEKKAEPEFSGPDAEILAFAKETERLRRQALRAQAEREILEARKAMEEEQYLDAVKHYRNAGTYLGEIPNVEKEKRECRQGIAHGYFLAGLEEDRYGRRKRAIELMKKAKNHRHPKARRQLETWLSADDPDAEKTDVATIRHRVNEKEYKDARAKNAAHLKRARQLMATRELDKAMEECETVLKTDKYNEEAIQLRQRIIAKEKAILKKERETTHDGMIADVDKAWRPVYAPNVRDANAERAAMVTRKQADDPRRRQELEIEARMKEMRLPAISFKPPATIADAVDFFVGASRDYDRADKPLEQRGFNIILRTPESLKNAAAQSKEPAADGGFGAEEDLDAAPNSMPGLPVIPYISASDLSFYDALKYVCDSVDYKFKVHGPMIIVMQKNMSIDEMVTRSYPVLASFINRVNSASTDLKELRAGNAGGGGGFGAGASSDGGEESQERDWMKFFEMLGVSWPEGSSIYCIKSLGQLRVKNTYENLAEVEKALTELNADPRLIEIEARFVEVSQDDLNSLGFEWILNSDYALGVGSHLARALRIRDGRFGSYTGGSNFVNTDGSSSTGGSSDAPQYDAFGNPISSGSGTSNGSQSVLPGGSSYSQALDGAGKSNGATWYRWGSSKHGKIGLNAINGDSSYTTGHRWLSDLGNHVSGDGVSNNDRFMRLNAFLGGVDLSMILHMLSQRSDTDLLSAPKVLTRPGEEAVMKVVTEYIYPTDYNVQLSQNNSSWGGNASPTLAMVEPESFTMREVGVILQATPTLTDEGNLIDLTLDARVIDEPTWKNYGMRIPYATQSQSVDYTGITSIFTGLQSILSSLGKDMSDTLKESFAQTAVESATSALNNLSSADNSNITYYEAPMEQPFFHQRSVQSSVSVYPGATIVMGGLITEVRRAMDDKIPVLGDIPFLGRFFRSHAEKTQKHNLLIFVTTRLVDAHGREVPAGSSVKEQVAAAADGVPVQPAPAPQAQP